MKKTTIILLVFGLFIANNLNATVHYVKTTVNGNGDGTSWSNASNDLQMIIDSSVSGDSIFVAAGTYIPTRPANNTATISEGNVLNAFVLKAGRKIYGGFAGTETNLSSRNWRSNTTILSGQLNETTRAYHVFIIAGRLGVTACLDGFTITRGKGFNSSAQNILVNGYSVDHRRGAGIHITETKEFSPVIRNLIVTGNESIEAGGGAIFCGWGSPNTRIENVVVTNNIQGGGIRVAGAAVPTLINCLITKNTTNGNGSGIVVTDGSTVPVIINCTIADNTANNYGGIYSPNPINVENTIVWGNTGTQVTFNLTGSSVNYCLFQNTTPAGTSNLNGSSSGNNPQFIDATNGNYQLSSGSACIDKGNNAAYGIATLATDFDNAGNLRLSNGTIDLGAYEYQNPGLGTGEREASDDLVAKVFVFPNPARGFVNISSPENSIVEIFNINGSIVQQMKSKETTAKLDIKQGVYFVKTSYGKKYIVQKLIVE